MKKILILIALGVGMGVSTMAQEKADTLHLNWPAMTFTEFATRLGDEFHIRLYFKPEWVTSVVVPPTGNKVVLAPFLDSLLRIKGINYIKTGEGQYFLTGKTRINPILQPGQRVAQSPENPADKNSIRRNYLGINTYEKQVKEVIIGKPDKTKASRPCFLSGRITNSANGEPVIGAAMVVEGTNQGVTTDGEGNYSLPLQSGQTYRLNISCLGMEGTSYRVVMNETGTLNIELSSKLIDVKEVIVRSDQHQNVRGLQMGFQSIGSQEMKKIPMVMGERDIFKVANLLPGVQTVGEGSAGYNVRGSASDQNLFLINEIPVLNTGHLFGFFSAFNPDMISGFNLYKSNFPVEYGGRLAAIFDISSRKGNKKDFGARGSISPVTASLLVETPVVKDKSSFMVSARSTYSDWILNRLNDAKLNKRQASFYDIMSGFHTLIGKNSSLQVFGYYSKDQFSLSNTNDYRYENLGASATFDTRLGNKWNLKSSAILSNYTNYQANKEQAASAYDHQFRVGSDEMKFKFTGYPFARHKMVMGGYANFYHLDQGTVAPLDSTSILLPIDFGNENGLEYALFASDEYTVSDRFSVYFGLRYSFFNYLGPGTMRIYPDNTPLEPENMTDSVHYGPGKTMKSYSGPEPRLSLNYQLGRNLSIKASYNRMRQYLFMLSNTAAISPTDRWKLVDPYIAPPVADQVSLGVYKNFNDSSIETSLEAYYKTTDNCIEYKDKADLSFNPLIETIVLQGKQEAYGVEFLIRRNTGRLTGWISYTFSRSFITIDGPEDWQKINMGKTFPANYDKPHALNMVGNLTISRRLSISSNIVYNTGRPITYPTGYFYADNLPVINYSLRNEFRIPDYFRVDLSVNIEGNLLKKKIAHSSWAFSVYNLTGRRNAYSVYFVREQNELKGYKLSIYGVPIFTVSYLFKLGNYATE
jgi:hypothetical protein